MRSKKPAITPVKLLLSLAVGLLLIVFGPISVLTTWGRYKEKTIADRLFPDDLRAVRQHPRRHSSKLLEERHFRSFPEPLVRHAYMAGWQGIPSLTFMRIFFDKAKIKSPLTGKMLHTQIRVLSSARLPDRIAQYRARVSGVPMDHMAMIRDSKGSIMCLTGGLIPNYSYEGPIIDRGMLVAWLAEAILVPGGLISHRNSQYNLEWTPIDERSCGVTIRYNDLEASGVFTINEEGFVQSFTSDDMVRAVKGSCNTTSWTITYSNWYGQSGIAYPGLVTAIWHLPEGDEEYFSCTMPRLTFW